MKDRHAPFNQRRGLCYRGESKSVAFKQAGIRDGREEVGTFLHAVDRRDCRNRLWRGTLQAVLQRTQLRVAKLDRGTIYKAATG